MLSCVHSNNTSYLIISYAILKINLKTAILKLNQFFNMCVSKFHNSIDTMYFLYIKLTCFIISLIFLYLPIYTKLIVLIHNDNIIHFLLFTSLLVCVCFNIGQFMLIKLNLSYHLKHFNYLHSSQ